MLGRRREKKTPVSKRGAAGKGIVFHLVSEGGGGGGRGGASSLFGADRFRRKEI